MLAHRLRSGFLMGGALLAAIFLLPAWGVLPVLLVVTLLSMLEFYGFLQAREIPHFKWVGVTMGVAYVAATWMANYLEWTLRAEAEIIALFAAVAAVLLRQLAETKTERPLDSLGGTLLGLLYVPFLFGFIVKLLTVWGHDAGRLFVLYLVVVVKFTDIGAYFIGCAIGRHKLLPRVSPAKTWEGVIGGLLVGTAAGWAYWQIVGRARGGEDPILSLAAIVGIGLLLSIFGIVGDLIESLLKRAAGVKDSGRMIQGMGGLLDVLDSLLFAAPVLYIALHILRLN
ncbi:MAG: CDP-archaeol synthase [Kiritimatiellae bacterium]|nr:CDP-archaeol synthase [Kiritimatiellia bacterium]MCO5069095.1 phosphatidate cytidylyltransferase [Kiritimatiellia bacterium]